MTNNDPFYFSSSSSSSYCVRNNIAQCVSHSKPRTHIITLTLPADQYAPRVANQRRAVHVSFMRNLGVATVSEVYRARDVTGVT